MHQGLPGPLAYNQNIKYVVALGSRHTFQRAAFLTNLASPQKLLTHNSLTNQHATQRGKVQAHLSLLSVSQSEQCHTCRSVGDEGLLGRRFCHCPMPPVTNEGLTLLAKGSSYCSASEPRDCAQLSDPYTLPVSADSFLESCKGTVSQLKTQN